MRPATWIALLALGTLGFALPQAQIPFTRTTVDANPPNNPWYKMAGDIDGDGQADVVIGGSGGPLVWYTYPSWSKTQIASGGYDGVNGELADLDGDGDLDVVMGGVVWFRNPRIGGGSWTKVTVASWKAHDIEIGDFDQDGKLDIAARDQNAFGGGGDQVRVYKQNSPTSWTELILACPAGEGLSVADLDTDGDPDIVIGTRWFERTGNITQNSGWTLRTISTAYTHPHLKVDVADLNKDGRPDVVVSPAEKAGSTYRISWFEAPPNPRTGTWTERTIANSVEAVYHALEAGDMDNDGDTDVVVAEMHQGADPDEVIVYRNAGSGTSWTRQVLSTQGSHDIVLADFGNDGDLDILGANHGGSYQPVELWVNDTDPGGGGGGGGLGNWERHVIDANKPWRAVFIYPGDFDRDGDQDIATGGWWYRNPGTAGGSWTRNTIGAPLNNVAAVHDFDGDGDADILGTEGQGSASNRNFVWARNNGSGSFTILSNISTGGSGDFLQGIAVARFSNGGPLEAALSWHNGGGGIQMLTVPANASTGQWSWRQISSTTQSEQLSAGDIDRDGDQDLLLGTKWLRNDGGSWSTHTLFNTGSSPDRNRLADIDGDGRLDAVIGYEAISTTGKLAWYEQPGSATSTWAERVIATITGPMSLDVADMDGDGDLDVVAGEHDLSNPSGARIFVFENPGGNATGTWASHTIHTGDEHHDGAIITDIEGDGDRDVISIGWGHGRVLVYENTSTAGGPPPPPPPQPPAAPSGLTATARSDSRIDLQWVDNAGNESGFEIDRGPSSTGPWTQVAAPGQNSTTYQNTGLSPSTTYFYRVRATNSDGDSAPSNVADATTLSAPPPPPPPPPGSGGGLTGVYYDNLDFTGFALSRTDAAIDNSWGTGSPDASIGPDTFSVRWSGRIEPLYSEIYTFSTVSDDGVRLRVDGQLLIDNWTNHGPTTDTGTISLQAGQRYDFALEYYEDGGGAVIQASWSSASQAVETIPASQFYLSDSDGDGMADEAETVYGLDPQDGDQDGNGIADGGDDWDGDAIDNATEIANGVSPGQPGSGGGGGGAGPPPPAPAGGSGSSGGCGATGWEAVILFLGPAFVRRRFTG